MDLRLLQEGARRPTRAFVVGIALLKGQLCRLSCQLRGVRFEAGKNFRLFGSMSVRGPGRVLFGDNVHVSMHVTPWTYHADAVIRIGDDSFVNGTRFGCRNAITIGRRAILADARIMDTDFHSVHADRHSPEAPVRVLPIVIGNNVWIAAKAGILPGTTIGDNAVVGYGAVCSGAFPADSVIAGNPARVIKPLPGAKGDS